MAKIISFASQKGGCGKSSVTTLVASVLAYREHKKVAVLDFDSRQKSLANARENELASITPKKEENGEYTCADPRLYKSFMSQGEKPYVIESLTMAFTDALIDKIEKYNQEYDYVFFDLPGSIDNNDFFNLIQNCDFVFIPFIQEAYVFQSNAEFAFFLVEHILNNEECRMKNLYYFWNRYKETVRPKQFEEMETYLKANLPEMKEIAQKLGDTDAMGNTYCKSTVVSPAKEFMYNKGLNAFITEIIDIISKD
jgi:cellulose biosynthesis protein BcsQ